MNKKIRIVLICAGIALIIGLSAWAVIFRGQENRSVSDEGTLGKTAGLQLTEAPSSSPISSTSPLPAVSAAPELTAAQTPVPSSVRETEIMPTCEEPGSIIREDTSTGITTIQEGRPALGHDWAEWEEDAAAGLQIGTCSRCGAKITRRMQSEAALPRIDLTGSMEGISKADRVTLGFDFTSQDMMFSCYSYTTWQGHSTLGFPKKNFTIRLYDDEQITKKHRLTFREWQREHKYVLKANYRDVSQVRNLAAAGVWADMAAIRPNLFSTLRHTSNYGAVDGFPVAVYHDGAFLGLYTMNLHIDDDLYQMSSAYDAVVIANDTEPDETRFRAEAAFEDEKSAWEVEFCGTFTENQWVKDKLNGLIRFVMEADDETFRQRLNEYLDVDAAVDYLIFIYAVGLPDNAEKDLVLLKYSDCDAWIPTVYDMEHAFGLTTDGSAYLPASSFLPQKTDGVWDSGTGSLLWDRLLQQFEPELRARYAALRQSVLTEDALTARVTGLAAMIPREYCEMDLERWPRNLPEGEPLEQMTAYIRERLPLLDALFSEP